MALDKNHWPRGSEWRKWDLHIHTPASFHWDGARFDQDPTSPNNKDLVDEMINALNEAEPSVFAFMDYWTFDGWFALQHRLKQEDAPNLEKTVFPGIELRLVAPMSGRLNAHVIFSDEIEDQLLIDFLSDLKVAIVNRPLSKSALISLARGVTRGKLDTHGYTKELIDADDALALCAGSEIAEITCESYKEALSNVKDGYAVGFMPFDTNDGLSQVKWAEHYAYSLGLFRSSPIFETRKPDLRDAFVGEKTEANESWFDAFQESLQNIPRLAVSGSDAHRFKGTSGSNNKRGYGDYPSGKITWIKADPTFRGLLQAIKEPAKRSYIGERPPKLTNLDDNKSYFIDTIDVQKSSVATHIDTWLDGSTLQLNPDLVAIIGNKGSGKSALADVIALLGNSKQKKHFSFLKKDRFRGRNGDPARHFLGTLTWSDTNQQIRSLNEDPPEECVELVRYIPQGHFEELCNDHISHKSNAFEKELRAVIFSHAGESVRLGALDFDQLLEQQESSFRAKLSQYRNDLAKLNEDISGIEEQLKPEVISSLQEQLRQKKRLLDEHNNNTPPAKEKPTDELTIEQQKVASELEIIGAKLTDIEDSLGENAKANLLCAEKIKACNNLNERLSLLGHYYEQFKSDVGKDTEILGLDLESLVTFSVDNQGLEQHEVTIIQEQERLSAFSEEAEAEKNELTAKQKQFSAQLNAPQLAYQRHLEALDAWQKKYDELFGTDDSPETIKGLETRISQLEMLPQLRGERFDQRLKLVGDIFDILNAQRVEREKLFKPVQDLIQSNSLIRDEYKLQFQAALDASHELFAESLFSLIKQNIGDFRGDDESFSTVRRIAEKYDFNNREDILTFVTEMHNKVEESSAGSNKTVVGISPILRKGIRANEVYDMIFSLSFLEPRYSLLFQGAQIEQLSPGQRGSLLLIFYLLVDKERTPIILDQPEENLDNETVVSLLVPVLSEAKKKRQIIMVTHNPNLAVVCDAEQIIYSEFDRNGASKITYSAGSIENLETNTHVVNVLEGTMRAFDNRRIKYG